jgi:hypothetical protein
MEKLIITDFDCCPHCGSTFGYYTKVRSKGLWHDNTRFDHITKENTEMHDNFIDIWESKWIYCAECNKKICKRINL